MLKRGITVLIIILLLTISIKAETSTDLIQFTIKQAYIDNNLINIKLESQESDFLIHIKIEGDNIQAYYSNQLLPKHTTKTFKFSTDLNYIHKVTITPYKVINNENVVYYLSEQSYIIDDYIEQEQTQEEYQPTEEIQEKPEFTDILKDILNLFTGDQQTQPQPLIQEPITEKIYIYGNGLIASKDNNQEIRYYHKDHLGSTRAITDEQGEVQYSTDYYPFGNSYNEVGDTEYTYTGKEKDNTGLFYYGARYYDPNIGRFTQLDPILTPSESPYAYVKNNPLKFVDPTGMYFNEAGEELVGPPEPGAKVLIAYNQVDFSKVAQKRKEVYMNELGYSEDQIVMLPFKKQWGSESKAKLAEALKNAGKGGNILDYADFIGHSGGEGTVGMDYIDQDIGDIKRMSEFSTAIGEGTYVNLIGCHTGGYADIPNLGKWDAPIGNIAFAMSLYFPGAYVSGSTTAMVPWQGSGKTIGPLANIYEYTFGGYEAGTLMVPGGVYNNDKMRSQSDWHHSSRPGEGIVNTKQGGDWPRWVTFKDGAFMFSAVPEPSGLHNTNKITLAH